MHYGQKRCLEWFQFFWIYQGWIYGPGCDLSHIRRFFLWPRRRFHVCLRKRWNSLFWGEISYRYQLGLTGLLYHLKFVFLVNFLFSWSIHLGCIYIYNCYIFFLDWSFDHYVLSTFVSFHSLCFKVYFVWNEYCYSCFQRNINFLTHSMRPPSP